MISGSERGSTGFGGGLLMAFIFRGLLKRLYKVRRREAFKTVN